MRLFSSMGPVTQVPAPITRLPPPIFSSMDMAFAISALQSLLCISSRDLPLRAPEPLMKSLRYSFLDGIFGCSGCCISTGRFL